jgi:hypothetical protein
VFAFLFILIIKKFDNKHYLQHLLYSTLADGTKPTHLQSQAPVQTISG